MRYPGFSLVECMVYCMVLAILFTTWFHGIIAAYAAFTKKSQYTTQLSNGYAAYDLLVRDIRQASAQRTDWKRINVSEIIWHAHKTDIGWLVRDNKLIRIEGIYDIKKQVWHKKKQSVAACNVKRIIFIAHGTALTIDRMSIEIMMPNTYAIKTDITLHNGVLNG